VFYLAGDFKHREQARESETESRQHRPVPWSHGRILFIKMTALHVDLCAWVLCPLTIEQHFISSASDEIQSLFSLQANTSTQLQQVIQYFGEDPKRINSSEFFGVFAEFITKFEVSRTLSTISATKCFLFSHRKRICTIWRTNVNWTKNSRPRCISIFCLKTRTGKHDTKICALNPSKAAEGH
jgi:hypothetical protein